MDEKEIFDLKELNEINEDKRKLFEYLYSKQDLAKYVQVNKKKYQDKKTKEWKSFELKYLSWAYAYREMTRLDPEASYNEHTWPMMMKDGTIQEAYQVPYLRTETGYFVRVSVTMFGRTTSEWLAVMDSKNKALLNPTATDINKALKRCYVKALALHGLGLFLYVGEDLPEDIQAPDFASDEQQKELNRIFDEIGNYRQEDPARLAAMAMQKLNISNDDGHLKKFKELTVKDYQNILSLAKPQLLKIKNEVQAAQDHQKREQEMAKQLDGLGYPPKETNQEEEDYSKTAQNEPLTDEKPQPDISLENEKQPSSDQGKPKRNENSEESILTKYQKPDTNDYSQEALFRNLGEFIDRSPVTN